MLKNCFLFLVFLHLTVISYGQHLPKMNAWQDSLQQLGMKMFARVTDAERIESNSNFVKTLVSALKETNSFHYQFENLKMISILKSPDNSFRIFSWNIPLADGSFLYYGSIQFNSPSLKLKPLLDKTFQIEGVDKKILANTHWYGAQYYDIVSLSKGHFVLLGWKGHHADYTQKVIDILNISSTGEIEFGAPVFSEDKEMVRKVFSYTREASMYLKYEPQKQFIIFDHIVPADPNLKGNYKYYGPDLTYDAYHVKDGKLLLNENITVQNPVRGDEDQYNDPLKPKKSLKSGL